MSTFFRIKSSLSLPRKRRFFNKTAPWMREVIQIGIYGLEKNSLLVTSHQAINENYSHKQIDTVTKTKIQIFSNLTHNLSCQLSFFEEKHLSYNTQSMLQVKLSPHQRAQHKPYSILHKIDTQSQLGRFQLSIQVTRFIELDAYKCTHLH